MSLLKTLTGGKVNVATVKTDKTLYPVELSVAQMQEVKKVLFGTADVAYSNKYVGQMLLNCAIYFAGLTDAEQEAAAKKCKVTIPSICKEYTEAEPAVVAPVPPVTADTDKGGKGKGK